MHLKYSELVELFTVCYIMFYMNPFQDKETGVELELEEQMPLLEWLANNYTLFRG